MNAPRGEGLTIRAGFPRAATTVIVDVFVEPALFDYAVKLAGNNTALLDELRAAVTAYIVERTKGAS